jgi:prepilin-type N-terminal cleavage/methylation domain-containing protein
VRSIDVKSRLRFSAAFTLLEIIIVIALMGMLATILTVGASRLLADRKESPAEVFWSAVGEARKYALMEQCEVRLSFDREAQAFVASTAMGTQSFPINLPDDIELNFLGMRKGESSILVGGRLIETSPLEHVRFFDDGTCTPFRVQILVGTQSPLVLEIDPWTCAEVLRDGRQN